jgi:hypothetical protein
VTDRHHLPARNEIGDDTPPRLAAAVAPAPLLGSTPLPCSHDQRRGEQELT